MGEAWWWMAHGAPAEALLAKSAASAEYRSATAFQRSSGACWVALAASCSARPGSEITLRSAAASPCGSPCATRSPAPSPRSSTACGNAVDDIDQSGELASTEVAGIERHVVEQI